MDATYRTSRRTVDPLGVVTAVAGLTGALCSMALWLYQFRSTNTLLGGYAWEITHGGPLRTDLIQLAFVLGIVALVGALVSSLGSLQVPITFPMGLILGAVALSYPIMAMTHVVNVPIRPVLFH